MLKEKNILTESELEGVSGGNGESDEFLKIFCDSMARNYWFYTRPQIDRAVKSLEVFSGGGERFEMWREYMLESIEESWMAHGGENAVVKAGEGLVNPRKPRCGGPR